MNAKGATAYFYQKVTMWVYSPAIFVLKIEGNENEK